MSINIEEFLVREGGRGDIEPIADGHRDDNG
jgi:hypothetical protein